jgi:hypothetical protein
MKFVAEERMAIGRRIVVSIGRILRVGFEGGFGRRFHRLKLDESGLVALEQAAEDSSGQLLRNKHVTS